MFGDSFVVQGFRVLLSLGSGAYPKGPGTSFGGS